ncbi:mitochondrial ubiquitin ligase activator of NFKB 1-like [Amphiura filiformis]|uniref:mitochondrial ubiquitin ligase activator of NFKB 1-like n=1 Tax=Amphiura filiformis TaxID=82378 RepID=UPI003B21D0EE
MPRNRRESKCRKYLVSTVVLVVVVELYNITHARVHEFLFIAFATGSIAAVMCGYLMARCILELEDITKAPILKISPNLKKIITGEANHVIPYARVEGQVKAVHQPIRSMYIDGITGVMQRVECREYTSKWNRQQKKWVDTDHSTRKASKTVPFILTNGGSSIRVKDPEKASGLEFTTFYDKFHPTSESLLQSIVRWFSGLKTKGHQNVELILQQGKTLTGVGELRILSNGEVLLYPPSDGRVYILTTAFANHNFTDELKSSITRWKKFATYSHLLWVVSVLFGAASVLFDKLHPPSESLLQSIERWISGSENKGHRSGLAILMIPVLVILVILLVSLYVWFKYQWRMKANKRKAFNRRVQTIEEHASDDENEVSSSSSEKESSEDDDTNVCVVCMSEPRDCVLVDCGHVCVCRDCAQELNPYQCPICRNRILQVMPIYHA